MNRFGRSAALAGATLVALVLAIAASATTAKVLRVSFMVSLPVSEHAS